jgi:hypothetical protein
MAAGASTTAVVVIACLIGGSGCSPRTDQLRPENVFNRVGRQQGQLIEPNKCMLRVAILNRSFRDPVINETVWNVADEQSIPLEARRNLEANGLRLGLVIGELPAELESVLKAPPPHQVNPVTFLADEGEPTEIIISNPVEEVSLLMNRENRIYGKDYQSASGFFRVTANHNGTDSVSLRITPEIHHGPVQRTYEALAGGAYSPQQFKMNDGQQKEALGDLTTTISLASGQVAVIGCRTRQDRSLGDFLFTEMDSKGDQKRQKLVLIWADRNQLGTLAEKQTTSDRPTLGSSFFEKLVEKMNTYETGAEAKPETAAGKAEPPAAQTAVKPEAPTTNR